MSVSKAKSSTEDRVLEPGDIQWFIPVGTGTPVQVQIVQVFEENDIQCADIFETFDAKYRTVRLTTLFDSAKEARLERKSLACKN